MSRRIQLPRSFGPEGPKSCRSLSKLKASFQASFNELSYLPDDERKRREPGLRSLCHRLSATVADSRRVEEASWRVLEPNEEQFAADYDCLLRQAKVRRIRVLQDRVEVYTKILCCTDPQTGLLHRLGAFRISILCLDAEDEDVESLLDIFNESGTVDAFESGMQAPHVFANGYPCLGNAKGLLKKALGQRDYAAAVMIVIRFLQSVNVDDDAGQFIDHWPLADDALIEAELQGGEEA